MNVTDLGVRGTTGGVTRPIDVTPTTPSGDTYSLTGYTTPAVTWWDLRTGTVIAHNGTPTIDGTDFRYTPGASDPLFAAPRIVEGRFTAIPAGGGDPEPSQLVRFSIVADPA